MKRQRLIIKFQKSRKPFLAIFLCIVLLIAYFITNIYLKGLSDSKNKILTQLKSVVCTSAVLINGDLHEHLTGSVTSKDAIVQNDDNEIYLKLHQILQKVQRVNGLKSPVYTMIFEPSDSIFQFIVTSAETPYYLHSYENFPEGMASFFANGDVLDVYESENGKWLSAYAPILNSKNQVIALIQADQNFEEFISKAQSKLVAHLIITVAIVLPFLLLVSLYTKNAIKREEKNKKELSNKLNKIKEKNETIIQTNSILEETNAILDKKNEDLKHLTYIVTHDLKAPLRGVSNLISWFKEDYSHKLDVEGIAQIDLVQSRIGHMNNLIIDMLEYSKIGTQNIKKENVDIHEIINELITYLSIPSKVEINVQQNIPGIVAMKILVFQLFQNLISNAIKYNDKETIKVDIRYKENEHHWNFYVSDNGKGIPEKNFKKIFEIFNTLQPLTENSTGVGLSIVKKIVELHGGTIWVNSELGQGSTFNFTLIKPTITTFRNS